jgi:mono/diheme cytochrome c family protein
LGFVALLALGCGKKSFLAPGAAADLVQAVASPEPEEPAGDADRGKALVARFECSRCHEGTGMPAVTLERQCFTCHQKVASGELKGPKAAEARWHDRVLDLTDAPSLTSSQKRFRRTWLVGFLLDPKDLRPRLAPTMPQLEMTRDEARDIAAYLAAPDDPAAKPDLNGADLERGRKLMEQNACASCHVFTGVPPLLGALPETPSTRDLPRAMRLAPDLRFARRRLRPEALVAWVASPKAVKPDTEMPAFALKPEDARDIAAYVLTTPLAAPAPRAPVPRLPPLNRKVTYDEVSTRVFLRTCWHCHGEPDYAKGDGGPGNTGGFGFKARGINFADYGSVIAGGVDDHGERHSLFEKGADGIPRLLRTLLVRRDEEAGHRDRELRGMPLAYPSLSPEDVQLVESWIAQGHPR